MKRLTKRFEDGQAVMDCANCPESWNTNPGGKCNALYCRNRLKECLVTIEDILGEEYDLDRLSIMVNQCMTMREEVSQRFALTAKIPLDRLRELVEADRAGKCVILPDSYYRDERTALKAREQDE